jgi:dihydroneopterin aldolase
MKWAAVVRSAQEARAVGALGARVVEVDPRHVASIPDIVAATPGLMILAAAENEAAAERLERAGACVVAPLGACTSGRVVRLTPEEAQEDATWARLTEIAPRGVMPDACDARLTARWSAPALANLAARARAAELAFGFCGGLEAPEAPRLAALRPNWIIFDEALREGETLSNAKIAQIGALVDAAMPPERRLVRRQDRIVIRDFVLEVAIGVYAREYGRTQSVRFAVDVDMTPLTRVDYGFADVFSYEVIVDRMRALAGSRHFDLSEQLAEEVAAIALGHSRAVRARVLVEKLEVIDGAIGVEIVREKAKV